MKSIVIYNSQTGFTKKYAENYDITDKKYVEEIIAEIK